MKNNKFALITGASGGLGKEIAIQFAKKGINLILVSRNSSKLETIKNDLSKKFKIEVVTIAKDISNITSLKNILKEVEGFNIQFLINNAGTGSFEVMWDASIEEDQKMLNLNINALTYLMSYFLKIFVKNNSGSILNVSSTSVNSFFPGFTIYNSSKIYVSNLTKQTFLELTRINSKVKVKCLQPCAMSSDFFNSSSIKVGKDKLVESHSKQVKKEEPFTTPEKAAIFALELLDSNECMGQIMGLDKKMWSPKVSDPNVRMYNIDSVLKATIK